MSSTTVTLTGSSSELTAHFFPEIDLDSRFEYSCGLLEFVTYNSIPNITEINNKLHFIGDDHEMNTLTIPIGSYEINEIGDYIKDELKKRNIDFKYSINKNILKTQLWSNTGIHKLDNSVLNLFGFKGDFFAPGRNYLSTLPVNISSINTIRIDCNIVTGSYINGSKTHTLYEFAPTTDTGYKIVENPRNIVYLPITSKKISLIQILLLDQDGKRVDFRGETISVRIHIKRD